MLAESKAKIDALQQREEDVDELKAKLVMEMDDYPRGINSARYQFQTPEYRPSIAYRYY